MIIIIIIILIIIVIIIIIIIIIITIIIIVFINSYDKNYISYVTKLSHDHSCGIVKIFFVS